ncbi:dihydroorotate dehydrogenase electron transfer subunit [Halalkalibacter akibai]|uniref:Dihydroorotate dehydrogenase B (NAD(+)), electron transfer subunit n=1 Tax=Halalkalibacter akibai (strain ATCC 43226 / DSM 21942 / CIP 109018 / JCM 9157 / 1139) TaxID=1236973 RepID=W4QP39_HALA3|nr:dihydroorotate dehydrogenase electron transfer subunit [Halalkalibacter akibai]GAE33885.1 dihydroorotate dehydrogenase electron transfer subunit [Halalkalibacter akibai JCM 9157]
MIKKDWLKINHHETIAANIMELKCSGPLVKQMTQPGQFLHLRVDTSDDLLLRRPISICDVDLEEETVTMLYRVEGKGTKRLSSKQIGEKIDVLGPLGNGFPLEATERGETALLVGGGIGVPPLYNLSKQLKKRGVHVIHVLGFQSKENVFYEKEFLELGETYVVTVDGTYGEKGFVTDVIKEKHLSFDTMYTCGPTPMLSALQNAYSDRRLFLSLEERMGCGVGACFACVCHVVGDETGTKYRKVCTDGPVFPVGEVVL